MPIPSPLHSGSIQLEMGYIPKPLAIHLSQKDITSFNVKIDTTTSRLDKYTPISQNSGTAFQIPKPLSIANNGNSSSLLASTKEDSKVASMYSIHEPAPSLASTKSPETPESDESYNKSDIPSSNKMISLSSSPYPDATNISIGILIAGVILISAIILGILLRWKRHREQQQPSTKSSLEDKTIEIIQSGELEQAIQILLNYKSSLPYKEHLEQLQKEFYAGKTGYRNNEIGPDEYYEVRNKVTLELLDLLQHVIKNRYTHYT